jgi:hypothetical protein
LTFAQVKAYVDEHNVPRNALLSQGYKSVGDWHSTVKSSAGDAGERAGRWAGKDKTECGLHQDYFKLKLLAMKKKVSTVFHLSLTSGVNRTFPYAERRGAPTERRGEARYRADHLYSRRAQCLDTKNIALMMVHLG